MQRARIRSTFRLGCWASRECSANPAGPRGDALRDFNTGRMRGVLQRVAEISRLGQAARLPPRTGMGVAFYFSHLGYFAEVVQATVAASGDVQVDHVWIAADVGSQIINPSGADNQAQGAALDGIGPRSARRSPSTAAAWCRRISIRVQPLRIDQAPPVEVHFLTTDHPPTGLGEPALPPVIPALCNAIFAATGKRVRTCRSRRRR